ncbi:hypothetical protein [Psychroserpens luteolus]|uniref:hypothetical protein n=1 Tax=Psychroserpens luteolus TaxID=2855840 RepID=UPI001E3F78C3|nr:hypothetical protein [Psychroserpens luteolus]MCD2257580.1 hypothetical protein [Psychroserpens luteolus]
MQSLKENKNYIDICFCVFLMLFLGCKESSFDSLDDMHNYINEEANGYVYHKTVKGIDFTLMYKPIDLIVAQELEDLNSENEIDSLRNVYKDFLYFNLYMSKDNKELLSVVAKNKSDFSAKVNTLVYNMNENVNLFTKKKDTIELIDFVYPRMYGMSNSTAIMFVYPRDEKHLSEEYLNFTIEDLGLNTGEVKFKIETKNIKSEPKLSFKN